MSKLEVDMRRGRRGRRVVLDALVPPNGRGRPPVVARTLALAHKMQAMIDRGQVADQAELARMFGFTRARISQILDLTLLAPDIQEQVLFAEETGERDAVCERELRRVVRAASWAEQRARWARRAPR